LDRPFWSDIRCSLEIETQSQFGGGAVPPRFFAGRGLMFSLRRTIPMTLLAVAAPALAAAQSGTGALTAAVTDATGGALVGATCELSAGRDAPRVAVVEP